MFHPPSLFLVPCDLPTQLLSASQTPTLPHLPCPLTLSPSTHSREKTEIKPTFHTPLHPVPHTIDTIPELRLRGAQLLEGSREMLQVLRELVLEVRELRYGHGCEVDFRGRVSFVV